MIRAPSVIANHFSRAHRWHAGGVAYGLRAHFFIAFFMIAHVVNVERFVLVVFNAGHIAPDVGFAGGVFG